MAKLDNRLFERKSLLRKRNFTLREANGEYVEKDDSLFFSREKSCCEVIKDERKVGN